MAQLRVAESKIELQVHGTLWERQNALLGTMYMPHEAEAHRDEDGVQVRFRENKGLKRVKNAGVTMQNAVNVNKWRGSKSKWRPSFKGRHKEAPRWTPWMPVVNGRIESEYMLDFELVMMTEDGKERKQRLRAEKEGEFNHWVDLTFRSTFAQMLEELRPAEKTSPIEPEEPADEPEGPAEEPRGSEETEEVYTTTTTEDGVSQQPASQGEPASTPVHHGGILGAQILGAQKGEALPSFIPPRYAI